MSGDIVASAGCSNLIHDLALLNSLAIKLIVVFGARPQIDQLLKERKLKPAYCGALRVTDEASISSVTQAVGDVKIKIEALLSMGLPNSPMADSAIKVASGNYVTGRPYGILNGVDLKLTGRVRSIEKETINTRLGAGEIVLITPLGYSATGEIFNLSSIEVATQVAIDLAADKLIMFNSDQILQDENGETIRQITCAEAKKKLDADSPCSMDEIPTAFAQGIKACEAGVKRIHYIAQNTDGSLLQELFTLDGVGTLLTHTPFDTVRQAHVNDITGIYELIAPLDQNGILVQRSVAQIAMDIDNYVVLVRDGTVIACAVLHEYAEEKIMELACVAVHPDYQNQFMGEMLYQYIESQARATGAKEIIVLTTQTAHWFIERGFVETAINALPVEKQKAYNYQRNAKILLKSL